MGKTKIIADSTCDLTKEILEKFDITLTPLTITVGGKDYHDGIDIDNAKLFEYAEKGVKCATSAVNIYEYENIFEEMLKKYDSVIHINISNEFSSCYQNACIAAKKFEGVYVIDSRNLSSGSGHIVYDAAVMAQQNADAKDIYEKMLLTVPKVEASFVIDDIDYLYKGGRCSGVEAFGANLLKIKPSIEVIDGKMEVGKKYRGTFEQCLEKYAADRLKGRTDIDCSRVFITHSMCKPETVRLVRDTLAQFAGFNEIIETTAGCTISTHCGPNTLGIMFKRI